MALIQRLALLSMMLMFFVVPMDGISIFAALPVVKFAGLLAFGFVAVLIMSGTVIRGTSWFIVLSMLYISWILLSFLWTSMPVDYQHPQAINSQQSVKAHLYLLGVVVLLFQIVRTEADLQWLLLAFLLGSFGLLALFLQSYDPGVTTVRHGLKERDANEMSVQLALALPVALYLLSMSKFWWIRILSAVYLPLAIVSIFATGSRTGFVVLLIGLLGVLPLLLRSGVLIKLMSAVALCVAVIVAINTIPEKTFERILSTGSALTEGTLNERSITWQKAWVEWNQSPVFGHGLGSFRRMVNKYNVDYTAHNSFISISVEQGLVGLALYLMVISLSLYYAWQLDKRRRIILMSMVLVAVMGQMTLTLHEAMYIWLAYALAATAMSLHYLRPSLKETVS